MPAITSTDTKQEAVPDPRLRALRDFAAELAAAEKDAEGWRTKRNKEINRLCRLAHPPRTHDVAEVAGVRHTFISRIVQGNGKPVSGSRLGRSAASAKPPAKRPSATLTTRARP